MKFTEAALKKLQSIIPESQNVRIRVIGGGCSGMSYRMDFESYKFCNDNDRQLVLGFQYPFCAVIDKKSWLFLEDVEIDYQDGLNGKGFEFHNPKAKRVCGCGTSFST